MKKVSLVMIVKNEEKYISRCLESVKDSVDEMIVVDTGSTDNTKELAKKLGAKVFDYKWNNNFADARNFSLSCASNEWILMLDADEFLNNNYRYLIQEHIHKPDVKIGRIKITSVFEENGLKQYATSYISRLFPKGILFKGNIHEQLDSDLPREIIDVEVFHVGYFQTDKTGRNLPLLLETLKKEPNDCYILYQTAKEYKKLNDYKKAIEFFSRAYHFLTKNESFSPSLIVDFIQLLTKDGQYEHALDIASKEEVFLSFYPDFYFAKGILLMEHVSKKVNPTMDDLKRVEQTFQMCLNIGEQTKVDGMVGTGSFLPAYNLSILYETVGLEKEAVYYLNKAAMWGFEPAILRLNK